MRMFSFYSLSDLLSHSEAQNQITPTEAIPSDLYLFYYLFFFTLCKFILKERSALDKKWIVANSKGIRP